MTLFIDESHFKTTVMVALTTMLVMYTLYQSVARSLPQTVGMHLTVLIAFQDKNQFPILSKIEKSRVLLVLLGGLDKHAAFDF